MENHLPIRISIPFVAGVGLAAWLASVGTSMGVLSLVVLSVALLSLAGLVAGRRCDRILLPLMLFALGMFCLSARSADLLGGGFLDAAGNSGVGKKAITAVREMIVSAGFAHEETGPLLRALMTGDRSGLDRGTVAAFRRSGASHLLALSGLHLGVIAVFLNALLSVLGNGRPARIVRSGLLVLFCAAYTIACGASPSLVRALLFIILQQFAAHCPGRRSTSADRLCIAATVQLALDPGSITSPAFQLSYLAMLGIIVIAPRLQDWYPTTALSYRFDPFFAVWKAAGLALSCQLTTAPLVWLRFGSLPRYFLLTNLFAMPVCEALLPVAILTLLLGSPTLLVRLTDWLATLLLQILEIIAGLSS